MGDEIDTLSFMVHVDRAEQYGILICRRLKEKLPKQQFTVKIQAKYGSKIIASEELKAVRKDVTAGCYGSHNI